MDTYNAVLGNLGESDILVGAAFDGTSCSTDSLDTDTVVRVCDRAGRDGDIRNVVVCEKSVLESDEYFR